MSTTAIFRKIPVQEIQEQLALDHIIDLIGSSLSGRLYAVNEHSEELFYKYLKLSSVDHSAFSYNWPYIIQATRGRGFCYQSNQSIVYFYLRKKAHGSYPYTLVVVNHLGYDSEMSVYEISEAAKKLNITSIIKNIDCDKVLLWNDLGFKETSTPWSLYSFRDDNTFPEYVYDIKKFINAEFSRKTKKIIKKFAEENRYIFIPYNNSFENLGRNLLEKNSEYLENKGVDFKEEVIFAHAFVFDETIRNKTTFTILQDDRLVAISFLTHVEDNLFFNAIINENQSNLMRYLLWKSVAHYCGALEEENRPLYLALQGSENAGQTMWKNFFHPIRKIARTHVTNNPEI